jgi:tetratricopeptide (TPR) repeat protein
MSEIQVSNSNGRTVTVTNPYVEIMLKNAHEMRNKGEYGRAIDIFDQVLSMAPANPRALHSKGDIFDLMGRYEEAVTCYDSALESDPNNAETWYNKGVTLSKMGFPAGSADCIHQGLSLSV